MLKEKPLNPQIRWIYPQDHSNLGADDHYFKLYSSFIRAINSSTLEISDKDLSLVTYVQDPRVEYKVILSWNWRFEMSLAVPRIPMRFDGQYDFTHTGQIARDVDEFYKEKIGLAKSLEKIAKNKRGAISFRTGSSYEVSQERINCQISIPNICSFENLSELVDTISDIQKIYVPDNS